MTKNRRNVTSEDQKREVLSKISQYTENGFAEAKRLHNLIMAANPKLCPRLWYGMPGYAKSKDSAVICFFRKDTFITFGLTESIDIKPLFNENQHITPSAWYITKLTNTVEKHISDVIGKTTL